jgi:hypothetical protein
MVTRPSFLLACTFTPSRNRILWRPQVSLKAFLLLVSALCVVLGLKAEAKHRERQVVGKMRKLGALVVYDYQIRRPPALLQLPWMRQIIGEECCADVVEVHVGDQVSDADLSAIEVLDRLECLDLDFPPIRFNGMTKAKLTNVKVTDECLAHLRCLSRLRLLRLGGAAVSDAGIMELRKELPGCKVIR